MGRLTESIAIKAPIEKVFEVITDFESYPGFLSEIESARVVKRGKAKVEVAFTANIVSRINYTLEMRPSPPKRLEWSLVEGDIMEGNDGSWELTRLEPNLTDATFSVEVKLPFWVPAGFADATLKSGLPKMMAGFKSEAEKRASPRPAAKKPAAKKKGGLNSKTETRSRKLIKRS
ncbi:MAG: SRPBCC family protein [Proteobacteria bacterium]|nr:SRPBCC family protein [Pseudomonadota bacterium]